MVQRSIPVTWITSCRLLSRKEVHIWTITEEVLLCVWNVTLELMPQNKKYIMTISSNQTFIFIHTNTIVFVGLLIPHSCESTSSYFFQFQLNLAPSLISSHTPASISPLCIWNFPLPSPLPEESLVIKDVLKSWHWPSSDWWDCCVLLYVLLSPRARMSRV